MQNKHMKEIFLLFSDINLYCSTNRNFKSWKLDLKG